MPDADIVMGMPDAQAANDFVSGFMVDMDTRRGEAEAAETASTSSSNVEVTQVTGKADEVDEDMDTSFAATQVLLEEEEEAEEPEEPRKPAAVAVAKEGKVSNPAAPKAQETDDGDKNLSPVERFARTFGSIWELLEKSGWQVAHGRDTMFCSMPGVEFFSFRPNINVFDTKDKACWKFIAQARESKVDSAEHAIVWDTLWPIVENHFGWYTMQCGPETMFVKPGTKFEDFKPNETIFQSKKGAVLKCLAAEVGEIELGDSVEGHQFISFEERKPVPKKRANSDASAPHKKAKAASAASPASISFKTPSPKVPKRTTTPGSKSKFVTPPTKRPATTPTGSTGSTGSKRKAPASKSGDLSKKKAKVVKKLKPKVPEKKAPEKKTDSFNFYVPEFRCTFGLVYDKLKKLGWKCRAGQFEYDYFSPDYTKENAVLNGNYFQSKAMLEHFLQSSGAWEQIENQLRDEHEEEVAELRAEAEEKHRKNLERQAQQKQKHAVAAKEMRAASSQEHKPVNKPAAEKKPKPAKKVVRKDAARPKPTAPAVTPASSFYQEAASSNPTISIGKVVKKLQLRGWTYRPGRFEYNYFKPGVTNMKTAKLNEDYFESAAVLEMYLKTTGLWDEIAMEIENEHFAKQEEAAIQMSQQTERSRGRTGEDEDEESKESESSQALSQSQSQPESQSQFSQPLSQSPTRLPTQHLKRKTSPPPPVSSPSSKKARGPSIDRKEVQDLTNDIWGNSHHFEFDE